MVKYDGLSPNEFMERVGGVLSRIYQYGPRSPELKRYILDNRTNNGSDSCERSDFECVALTCIMLHERLFKKAKAQDENLEDKAD